MKTFWPGEHILLIILSQLYNNYNIKSTIYRDRWDWRSENIPAWRAHSSYNIITAIYNIKSTREIDGTEGVKTFWPGEHILLIILSYDIKSTREIDGTGGVKTFWPEEHILLIITHMGGTEVWEVVRQVKNSYGLKQSFSDNRKTFRHFHVGDRSSCACATLIMHKNKKGRGSIMQ